MQHQARVVLNELTLISGELSEQLVLDGVCNNLCFNAQANQLEISVEDLILQDEDIEIYPLTAKQYFTMDNKGAHLYFHDENDLYHFQAWFKQHIDSFIIY